MPVQTILVLIVRSIEALWRRTRRRRFSPHRLAGYLTLATAILGLLVKLKDLTH